jgi:hypothetical protein
MILLARSALMGSNKNTKKHDAERGLHRQVRYPEKL